MWTIKKPTRLDPRLISLTRIVLHLLITSWLILVFYQGFTDQLGGDPVQALLDFTGIGALNLLIISLVITPLATYFKFAQLMVLRRPIGLYSALYGLGHLFVFVAFELQFEMRLVVSEIIDRPYITVGFVCLLILLTLAITSITSLKKKMGPHWFSLHNLVYLAVLLAGLHYFWLVKSAWYEPAIYLGFSVFLIILRRKKIIKIFK